MRRVRKIDMEDWRRYPFIIPEAYALMRFRPIEFELVIFQRSTRQWRIDGDFKGCSIWSLLGPRFPLQVQLDWFKPGIVYIRNNDLKCVFKVHII